VPAVYTHGSSATSTLPERHVRLWRKAATNSLRPVASAMARTHKEDSVDGGSMIHGLQRETTDESQLFLAHGGAVFAAAGAAANRRAASQESMTAGWSAAPDTINLRRTSLRSSASPPLSPTGY